LGVDGGAAGVERHGLAVKGGHLRLVSVSGGRRALAVGGERGARRVRLTLTTPTLIRSGNATCLDPARLGIAVLQQAVVRTVSLYNAFFAPRDAKLPFVEADFPQVVLTGHRLFHYQLPRQSYRQGRWMDFDGVVGWLEWEGDVGPLIPWLRAAEVVHVGQKATFGLGRVELTID